MHSSPSGCSHQKVLCCEGGFPSPTLLKGQPYSRELALKAGEISFVGGRTSAHNAFRVPLGIQTVADAIDIAVKRA